MYDDGNGKKKERDYREKREIGFWDYKQKKTVSGSSEYKGKY
jgi:hypothetical protein